LDVVVVNPSSAPQGRRIWRVLGTLIIAATFAASPAYAVPQDDIVITFVRHGESQSNARGTIDTSVPGSALSEAGVRQSKEAAYRLSLGDPDGVFASPMARAQQTAQYLADEMAEQVEVLPGLREIAAGTYEGQPQDVGGPAMFAVMDEWLSGSTEVRIPGAENGMEFLDRFGSAVKEIVGTGDRRPIAFSHGAAIAVWTLMSVSNPRFELFRDQPLGNTGYVVIQGNPTDGWRLIDWNGTKVG
jgi:broad specificity phosphatase PhoE